MDSRAAMARDHHRAALSAEDDAARHREARDELVKALRRDDPQEWTYSALARLLGCSPELVAKIIKPQRR